MASATVLKMSARLRPSDWKAMIMAIEISAAMRPYSIAVAPRSSFSKRISIVAPPSSRAGHGGGRVSGGWRGEVNRGSGLHRADQRVVAAAGAHGLDAGEAGLLE